MLQEVLEDFVPKDPRISDEMIKKAYKNVLKAKKSAIRVATIKGLISEETVNRLTKEIDSMIVKLEEDSSS
jgi:hypothetical protein